MGTTLPAEPTPASGAPGMRIQEEREFLNDGEHFTMEGDRGRGKKELIFLFEEFLLHLLFYSIRI